MHKLKFLRFGRSRTKTPASADSEDASHVSSSHSVPALPASSSRLHSSLQTSQQANPIATPAIESMAGYSASQLDHASLQTKSPAITENPRTTPTPSPGGLQAQSPTDAKVSSGQRDLLVVPQRYPAPVTESQQSLVSPPVTNTLDTHSGTLYGVQNTIDSRNVSVTGNMNTVNYVGGGNNKFLKKLLKETIPGAAFDSSARDPPPRCHPGTRLAILDRCVTFILTCLDERKMRWVVGAAGVGKSAILQSVAERQLPLGTLRASIFFFVQGRSDGSKAIITLAYQLAVQCKPYRAFIERELDDDPSLLQKAMSVQFNKLIVEPFIHHPPLKSIARVLIIIDGLDECDNQRTQEELLRLISNLCITIPSSPLVWLIASRPEPHITSFFNRDNVKLVYEKEEIPVDSDEAREDVERFLRTELTNIQTDFGFNLRVQWPSEQDFWKLAKAAGGLFVYAQTVTKYIGDPHAGNPKSQLDDVLKVIDAHPVLHGSREHPMALLDALYAQILSKVPPEAKSNMRKLLLALAGFWDVIHQEDDAENFIMLCNWLCITSDDAYAALRHLFSVLSVPRRDEAHKKELEYFHKSFIDYICDFTRSGFSPDIKQEAQQLNTECAFRVLNQAPDTIRFGDIDADAWDSYPIGRLVVGTGTGRNIALTWSAGDEIGWNDHQTRVYMYKMAIASIVEGVRNQQKAFYNVFCMRLLAMRFENYFDGRVEHLHQVVFEKSRCHEFIEQGLVKRVPVTALKFLDLVWKVELRFNRPMMSEVDLPDPWNLFCTHGREGEWGQHKAQAWTTQFDVNSDADSDDDEDENGDEEEDDDHEHEHEHESHCNCLKQLKQQLKNWQTKVPDHPVLVFFTLAGQCFVEFKFVDEEDGVSEWTYWLVHKFTEEKRKELGSTV